MQRIVLALQLLACAAAAAAQDPGAFTRTDYFVERGQDVRLFVRHVATPETRGLPILLVHGGSPGSEVIFDLPVPGYSLAEDLARRGWNVYLMDARGWGPSSAATTGAEPPGSSADVVADISTVVDDVLRTTRRPRLVLFGHASGGHWVAMYAAQNADKVAGLVLLNSMYAVDAPWGLRKDLEDPKRPGIYDESAGRYRLATAEALLAGWNRAIPTADKDEWRDPDVATTYVTLGLASDPTSRFRTPPSVRIPAGFRRDHYLLSHGKAFWNARDLKAPVLYMRGSRDHWSRPEDLQALQRDLPAPLAAQSRFITLEDATHFVFLDRPQRGRTAMMRHLDQFLPQFRFIQAPQH
jgi:pimeloyl-ACP methyl ester carboxylesterase